MTSPVVPVKITAPSRARQTVYPYQCTYKGETVYHTITAHTTLSKRALAQLLNTLHEQSGLAEGRCHLIQNNAAK
jgi:hypothetical protein